ncbi:ANTAR domain-containing protein [Pseudarthrobacter sp. 1C304]|uniref:ANTAR domain-containing protein n=1 Tax=Pseudarthrobacter sp. 1C304 TaxID=3457438 RepID=UPI003FD57FD6
MPGTRLSERLQDLLLETDLLEDFLHQLAVFAAEFAMAETGRTVVCSVRLSRRRRPAVLAASGGPPDADPHRSSSTLTLPLLEDRDAAATLTFFSPSSGAFDGGAVAACEALAARAAWTVRLAVRIDSAQGVNRDLLQAMRSRSVINLATGILMAQSRCSQSEAFELLTKVSNNRNVKLRVVAVEILRRFEGSPAGPAVSG